MIVGLTGGIGSGKTTVAQFFIDLGVPVYVSDIEAKRLMNTDAVLQKKIIDLLGEGAYTNGVLNRPFVANKIFSAPEILQEMNRLVHPVVAEDFLRWKETQNYPYVIKESAILIESGGHESCNSVIMVTAPEALRISRVMARDNATKADLIARMNHQISDDKRAVYANYIITNTALEETQLQVKTIHNSILKKINIKC